MLVLIVTALSWIIQMRTHRTEVHDAGEGDDPEVPAVDDVATIELGEEPALDTWPSGRSIE